MYLLVSSSARATSVATMWAHALRAAAGEIFLLRTTTNLCVVWPRCGSVTALPSDERQAGRNGTRRVLMDPAYPGVSGCSPDRVTSRSAWPGVAAALC